MCADTNHTPEPGDGQAVSPNPQTNPPTHVYCMYYFNPYEEWPPHRMSQVSVYETFEDACKIPEARTGLDHGDWHSIEVNWRWRLSNYFIERQRIQYAAQRAAGPGEGGA